jgi:transposase
MTVTPVRGRCRIEERREELFFDHERAFRAFGGVPKVVRHDNLKGCVALSTQAFAQ